MKKIQLDGGRTGLFAMVDDQDYDWLNQFKWRSKCGYKSKTCYAVRTLLASESKIKRGISMHCQIIGSCSRNQQVDHKDQNGLNNQKNNLRLCSQSQNNANRSPLPRSTSKYLGVCYWPEKGRRKHWIANISKNNKSIRIGRFKTEIEAAVAYNKKAKEIHGQFANLNKI